MDKDEKTIETGKLRHSRLKLLLQLIVGIFTGAVYLIITFHSEEFELEFFTRLFIAYMTAVIGLFTILLLNNSIHALENQMGFPKKRTGIFGTPQRDKKIFGAIKKHRKGYVLGSFVLIVIFSVFGNVFMGAIILGFFLFFLTSSYIKT